MLLHEVGHLGIRTDLAIGGGASASGEGGDQRILGQLAVLVVFVSGTELLDDAGDAVSVSVAAPSEPNATALVYAFDFAVGADP